MSCSRQIDVAEHRGAGAPGGHSGLRAGGPGQVSDHSHGCPEQHAEHLRRHQELAIKGERQGLEWVLSEVPGESD